MGGRQLRQRSLISQSDFYFKCLISPKNVPTTEGWKPAGSSEGMQVGPESLSLGEQEGRETPLGPDARMLSEREGGRPLGRRRQGQTLHKKESPVCFQKDSSDGQGVGTRGWDYIWGVRGGAEGGRAKAGAEGWQRPATSDI